MGFELTVSNVVSQSLVPVFHHILACLSVEKVTRIKKDRNLANLEFLRQRSPELTGILSLSLSLADFLLISICTLSLSLLFYSSIAPTCFSLLTNLTDSQMNARWISSLRPSRITDRERIIRHSEEPCSSISSVCVWRIGLCSPVCCIRWLTGSSYAHWQTGRRVGRSLGPSSRLQRQHLKSEPAELLLAVTLSSYQHFSVISGSISCLSSYSIGLRTIITGSVLLSPLQWWAHYSFLFFKTSTFDKVLHITLMFMFLTIFL